MSRLGTRYEKDPNVVSREIAGEEVLVPIRKQTADTAAIFVLNETGASIWNLVDGQRTLADIRDGLVQEYMVEPERAAADLTEIVDQLQAIGALRIVEHGL